MDLMTPLLLLLLLVEEAFAENSRPRARKRPKGSTSRVILKPQLPTRPPPKNSASPETEMLRKLLADYNRQDPPKKDRPTEVKLGIYVNSFYSISEQTMDYSVSMYLRQEWLDARLAFDPELATTLKLRMGENDWERIWVPDTFIRNEKRASFHEVTVQNRLLTLDHDGKLWYATKISATLSCPMTLQKYPMDTQECPMMFESFGYTMDTMYFQWLPEPVDINQDLELPQFTLSDTLLIDCSQNYTTGAYTCLEISFVLRRDIGYFLIQVYIPSLLIVILSWVSFWINIDATPARVSLGLLTVLTMTTQSGGARSTLPRVSYIKAIDVWMSMCLIFVFTSLLEFALVNVMSRSRSRSTRAAKRAPPPPLHRDLAMEQKETRLFRPPPVKKNCTCMRVLQGPRSGECRDHTPFNSRGTIQNSGGVVRGSEMEGKLRAKRIDKMSRKMFPLAFVIFNLVYWIVYAVPFSGRAGSKD